MARRDRFTHAAAFFLIGFGIDEQTALVKTADGWFVAGLGAVTLYDAAGATSYRAGETPEGLPA